jgi:hypothetical protein
MLWLNVNNAIQCLEEIHGLLVRCTRATKEIPHMIDWVRESHMRSGQISTIANKIPHMIDWVRESHTRSGQISTIVNNVFARANEVPGLEMELRKIEARWQVQDLVDGIGSKNKERRELTQERIHAAEVAYLASGLDAACDVLGRSRRRIGFMATLQQWRRCTKKTKL